MNNNKIRETLVEIGAIENDCVEVFAESTRDQDGLTVYRDEKSGVIFIDQFYVGERKYKEDNSRVGTKPGINYKNFSVEDLSDTDRRFETYKQFIYGKKICDIGCGAGLFLKKAESVAVRVAGVELDAQYRMAISQDGIECRDAIKDIRGGIDSCFLFHTLEHFPDPLPILKQIREHVLHDSGSVVIEVPHARDFLLDTLALDEFRAFTLWSQHLVLHTRASLRLLLAAAGFTEVHVEGVQRFGVSNHLHWLRDGKPGGHRKNLSILESGRLHAAYTDALLRIDATDTLVAVASA